MPTAVVLGGGASGLASAYYIQKYLPKFTKVVVLEASKRVGGWVNTTKHADGSIFECGPRSLRPVGEQGINTLQLAEELGLQTKILPIFKSDPAAKNRYLYVQGKLCALPNNFISLFKTLPPFSKPLFRSGLMEPFRRRSKQDDETVYEFFSRRFGKEIAELAIDSMCRGIFAGDCRRLSMKACFPPVHAWEQTSGSVLRGAFFGKKTKAELTGLAKTAREGRWASWSLDDGLQSLTDAMADAISNSNSGEIRFESPCTEILHSAGKTIVKTETDSIDADLVISAVYSKDLSSLLPSAMSDLKEELSNLDSVNVVVVNLEYKEDVLPVKGFGHLLPSSEGGPLLGVVYDSCTFPQHNRKGALDSTRLTVMLGGSWYDQLLQADGCLLPSSQLLWMATEAVSKHLNISAHPIRHQVTFQKECIPQYKPGHVRWVTDLEDKISESKLPLKLVGSSYRGPAINDCINNARKTILSMTNS